VSRWDDLAELTTLLRTSHHHGLMHHTAKAILDNDIDMIQSGFSKTPPINFQGDVDAGLSLAMPAASLAAIGLLLELGAQVNPALLMLPPRGAILPCFKS
jgi:hypothetical protein